MDYFHVRGAVSFESKIIVFKTSRSAVFDLDKNFWSEDSFEITEYTDWYHCIKVLKV